MASEDDKVRLQSASVEQKVSLLQKSNKSDNEPEGRLSGVLLFAVLASTIGGAFQFGYNIGCVNTPGQMITEWYKRSYFNMYKESMTQTQAEFAWSISVGIFAVGGMIGALASGWLADKMGRKGALLANNVLAVIAAGFMTSAKYVDIYYLITIGRFIIGINCGLNSGLVPMYLTELSPKNWRGAMGSAFQLLVTIGILVSQVLGLPFLFGTEESWPLIFGFIIIPAIIMFICLPLSPESPKYNLIVKGKKEQAEKDLIKLRGNGNVSTELTVIEEEAASTRNQPKVTFTDMFGSALRWPLFIAVMMMLAQQLSGINATMFYSTQIFKSAGLPGNGPMYATIAMGAINVAQTLVSVWLVDHPKCGRRALMLIGLIGMFLSSVLIVGSLVLVGQRDAAGRMEHQWASYAAIIFVLLFVISFATGPGSIPWFFVSEIFPSNARGNANSIACMSNWLANFVVGTFFLPLNRALGHYTFFVFAVLLAFFIVFTYKFVPETKNKTVEEINDEMYGRRSSKHRPAPTSTSGTA